MTVRTVGTVAKGGTAITATTLDIPLDGAAIVPVGQKILGVATLNPYPDTVIPALTVTDTKSNVYTVRRSIMDAAAGETTYIVEGVITTALSGAVGDALTLGTVGGHSFGRWAGIFKQVKFVGAPTSGNTRTSGSASSGLNTNAATATAGDYAIAGWCFGYSHLPFNAPAGWSTDTVYAGSSGNTADRVLAIGWKEDNVAGSLSPTATNNGSGPWTGAIETWAVTPPTADDTGIWGIVSGVRVPFECRAVVGGVLTSLT